jgi:hypothetical protein
MATFYCPLDDRRHNPEGLLRSPVIAGTMDGVDHPRVPGPAGMLVSPVITSTTHMAVGPSDDARSPMITGLDGGRTTR